MNKKIIFLLSILLIFLTTPSWGVVFFWQKQPQNERLVFQFKNPLSKIKVTRTGTQEISIILPAAYLQKEPPPAPVDLSFSRLVKELLPQKQNILIKTKTSAFGFISFWKKMKIDSTWIFSTTLWAKNGHLSQKKLLLNLKKLPLPALLASPDQKRKKHLRQWKKNNSRGL